MSERGWTGEALFVYQDAAFLEIVAHDNGYIYGQLPPGHTHANKWVRLNRPHEEWRERRALAELLDDIDAGKRPLLSVGMVGVSFR